MVHESDMRAAGRGAWICAWWVLAGCDYFGRGSLEVSGPTPYVRCLAGDPPKGDKLTVGALRLAIEKRTLRVTGLHGDVRIAAFAGPALGPPPNEVALRRLTEAKPDLLLLLGGLGDSTVTAAATVKALASLAAPTLVVAGGRDTRERMRDALAVQPAAARKVVDISAFDAVRLGRDTLVPVAGASNGHYAIEPRACGYGLDDLKARASALGTASPGEHRWLVAWEAPGEGGPLSVARAQSGIDAGSVDLAELARRIGAGGGVFAWPEVQLLRSSAGDGTRVVPAGMGAMDLRIVVPRLAGPAQERSDGTRVLPGFALLRFDASGLSVESIAEL